MPKASASGSRNAAPAAGPPRRLPVRPQRRTRAVVRTAQGRGEADRRNAPAAHESIEQLRDELEARDLLIANLLQRVEQLERRMVLSPSSARRRRSAAPGRYPCCADPSPTAAPPAAGTAARMGRSVEPDAGPRNRFRWRRRSRGARGRERSRTTEDEVPPPDDRGPGCADAGAWPVRGRRGSDRSCARADPGPGRRVCCCRSVRPRSSRASPTRGGSSTSRPSSFRTAKRSSASRRFGATSSRPRRAQGRPAFECADRSRRSLQLCRPGRHHHGRRSAGEQQQQIR